MSISISDLAYPVRKKIADMAEPISLGHSQQLVVAALGYRSLAAYQAAQRAMQEPSDLSAVEHVVLDYDMLNQRAGELGVIPTRDQLCMFVNDAFQERAPYIRRHTSYAAFEAYLQEEVDRVVCASDEVGSESANANLDGGGEVDSDFEVDFEQVPAGSPLEVDIHGQVSFNADTERPYVGHIVTFEAILRVGRVGRYCFGEVECDVTRANLERDRGDY